MEDAEKVYEVKTPADKLEQSRIVWVLVLILGFSYIIYNIALKKMNALNLNFVNFIFMFAGILLHGNLKKYIDAWTNMIQPFWALPALGIAGLSAKDIMGYCVITLLFSGVVIMAGFLIF